MTTCRDTANLPVPLDRKGCRLRDIPDSFQRSRCRGLQWGLSLGVVSIGSVLVSACGSVSRSEDELASATVAIYTTVTQQLVMNDNTFGPDHRFSDVLAVDRVEADAADAMGQGRPGDRLTHK